MVARCFIRVGRAWLQLTRYRVDSYRGKRCRNIGTRVIISVWKRSMNGWGKNVVKATSDTKAEDKPKPEQKQKSSRQSYTYNGKIIKIHDGDTMHIIDSDGRKHKIRIAYIDAPEINQAYGTQSRDNLIDAALNKKAKVRVFEADRYQREVAQVSVGTIDLNLMQIRDGAAWHYESYAKKTTK